MPNAQYWIEYDRIHITLIFTNVKTKKYDFSKTLFNLTVSGNILTI